MVETSNQSWGRHVSLNYWWIFKGKEDEQIQKK